MIRIGLAFLNIIIVKVSKLTYDFINFISSTDVERGSKIAIVVLYLTLDYYVDFDSATTKKTSSNCNLAVIKWDY